MASSPGKRAASRSPAKAAGGRGKAPGPGKQLEPERDQQPEPDRRAEREFADAIGFYWEDAGGTRMAGRVLGALLLADPPELSSSQLAAHLGVSAASVSTATRELINPGLVARVRVAGHRQDHFRCTIGTIGMAVFFEERIRMTRRFVDLLARGERLAAGKPAEVGGQIGEMRRFFEFILEEQAAILDRWDQRAR